MIKPLTMFVVLSAACTSSLAAPTVTGNTISWPDDGWYQVQSADGSTSICEGGNGCEVSSGSYIVINHTTGERFPDIVVGSTPAVTSIVVTGNTISWPDDGWYQVQSADGNTSVCEGGNGCEVSPGSYIVINHTTGERFPDIVVGSTPGVTGIVVTGNTISWPDDGWYQVQLINEDGIIEVCAGGSSCEVSQGTYIVINHSTEERFPDIVVGSTPTVTSIVVTGNTISWPDDGWYQVQQLSDYSTVCEGGASCEVAPGQYNVINHTTGERFENIFVTQLLSDDDLPNSVAIRLAQIMQVVSGNAIEEAVQLSIRMADAYDNRGFMESPFTVTDSSFGQLFGQTIYTLECPDGGNARGSIVGSVVSQTDEQFSFSACQIGGRSLSGTSLASRGTFPLRPNQVARYNYREFEIENLSENSNITFGGVNGFDLEVDGSYRISSSSVLGTAITVERDSGGYQILSLDTQSANEDRLLADGSPGFTTTFSVILEDGADITEVTTVQPFDLGTGNGSSDTGELRIAGPDYLYVLLADNGDAETFQLTITEDGITTAYTVDWASPFMIELVDPSTIDVGF